MTPTPRHLSVLCPTIPGREDWLAKFRQSLIDVGPPTNGRLELVVERGGDNWGEAINLAAEKATGHYFFLASDDLEVRPGWHDAAIEVCDRGELPAPKVLNTDGSLQSCGEWETLQPDGDITEFSRFPFLSRAQWDIIGPLLPPPGGQYPQSIHFADVFLGTNASKRHGIETVVCHAYEIVHHMVDVGRHDYATEEKLRKDAEAEIEKALAA